MESSRRDDVTVVVTTFKGREAMRDRAVASASVAGTVLIADGGDTPQDHSYADWWEGAYRAKTPYVALLHDDDWQEPSFVPRLAAALDGGAGYAFCEAVVHMADGSTRTNANIPVDSGYIAALSMEDLLVRFPMTVSPSCCMFRREDLLRCLLVGGIPSPRARSSVVCGPDKLMVMLPLLWRECVGWIRDPLVHFDGGAQSTTTAALADPKRHQDMLDNYEEAVAFYRLLRGWTRCW